MLVDYVQISEGIIGRSKYGEWAEEIDQLCVNVQKYPILSPEDMNRYPSIQTLLVESLG